MLDHEEAWHCTVRGKVDGVLFGQPYGFERPYGCAETQRFLQKLPDNLGERIAIYHGGREDSWYVARCCGILIQNMELPAITGWYRVTVEGIEPPS